MRTAFLLLALAAFAAPAFAQQSPNSLHVNDPTLANLYLSVPVKTTLEGNSAYTIEAWVRPASYTGAPAIVGNDWANGFWLGLSTTGRLRFYPRAGERVDSRSVIPLDTWTHVAATYTAGVGWALIVNGVVDTSGAGITGAVTTSTGDLRIGADRSSTGAPSYFWRGSLDDVRIWSEARTAAEVKETMWTGAGRPYLHSSLYAELRGCWDMQQASLSTCFDRASGLGQVDNEADMVGGDYFSFIRPQGPPTALNVGVLFDGTDHYGTLPMGDGFGNGLTVEAWVCPYAYASLPTIVGRGFESSFWLGLNHSGQVRFYPTGGVGHYVETSASAPLRRWTHVAATYRDGLTCLYLNGRLQKAVTTIHGPVGENGRTVWVGSDNRGTGLTQYPWNGILDEVRVTRGARSAVQIRDGMYLGYTGFVETFDVADEFGVSRSMSHASYDGMGAYAVYGTNARLVRSGAPMFSTSSTVLPTQNPGRMTGSVPGGLGLTPPDTLWAASLGTDLHVSSALVVTDVDVFVSAMTTDLSHVTVQVRSPALTVVDLVAEGDGAGRDLQSVFDDEGSITLATGATPYASAPVRPSELLSTFDGEASTGNWRLMMSGAGATLALSAWGLRLNGGWVDAPGAVASRTLRLSVEGAHPVRGAGQLAFTLPRDGRVRLALIDVQGRVVRELLSGARAAGEYHLGWNAASLRPGLYFARLVLDGDDARSVRVIVQR